MNVNVIIMEDIMNLIDKISESSLKKDVPIFNVGDTVSVEVNIKEGERQRVQAFQGIVIAKKGCGIAKTFTVRKVSYGVSVERVFPIHSPNVKDVKVISKGKVRRSKLYYLRNRQGKAAKVKQVLN